MFNALTKRFFHKKTPPVLNRKFERYFLSDENNIEIENRGYSLVQNAISENDLNFLTKAFEQLQNFPEYNINDKFQNSGRFQSPEIRRFVMNTIETFSKQLLPKLFNPDIYDENTTGAFQIKPPSKNSALNPHQDSPVIDELQHSGLFVWIPLCDITEKNGPVCVLPRSHRWGNHQRSLNVPWVFEEHTKTLWKYMKPVYMKKGDILCWDTALIHASSPNLTKETRVAITTTILPKNFEMVDYFKDNKTPKGKIEKYKVEKNFWESSNIMDRPPVPPNEFSGYENEVFSEKLSKKQLLELIVNA